MVPVVASNRVGREEFSSGKSHINFYGSSFIADQTGEIDGGAGGKAREGEIAVHTFDLEAVRLQRAGWGLFRDRRPELYRPLLSLDGSVPSRK
ncbi:unnamed protein product [Sphacelaria rigidula]